MNANPYATPVLPSDLPRWPKRWAFTLATVLAIGISAGVVPGFMIGYLMGWQDLSAKTHTIIEERYPSKRQSPLKKESVSNGSNKAPAT